MGFMDSECNGCGQKFPLDAAASNGPPKDGHVRDIGGLFNLIYVCPTCWNRAAAEGFNLESKEEAKRWKVSPKSSNANPEVSNTSPETSNTKQNKLEEASKQMVEALTPEVERLVTDVLLPNERAIYKLRSSPSGDRSQAILTNYNLIIISKGLSGGQGQDSGGILGVMMAAGRVSIRIYPIQEIRSIEIQPLQGITVGHFQVLTNATTENDNESKFLFDTDIGYYKSILLYRKLRQLQGFGMRSKSARSVPPSPKVPASKVQK
jgi:hypothetical protein